MELVSAAKMGTYETTVTPVMICYMGYTNLTGTYEQNYSGVSSWKGLQVSSLSFKCIGSNSITGGCYNNAARNNKQQHNGP